MNESGTRSLGIAPQEGTMVRCPLKGFAEIGAGRCVEWQKENGCHCENALPCLKLVEEHLRAQPHQEAFVDRVERNRKLADVRELKARAEQIEKARPEVCKNCGRKNGDKSPGGKLVILMSPCQRVDCTSRHCTWCLNTGAAHPKVKEEKPMPSGIKAEPCEKCGGGVGNRMPGQLCGKCSKLAAKPEKTRAPRQVKANGGGQAVHAPEPVSGDLASLLKAKAAELREQADHIDRAAEVLSR